MERSRARPLRVTLTGPAIRITLDTGARKAVEVAQWAARRARRALVTPDDLLWGLLADGSSESVAILLRCDADLRRIWSDLRRRHEAA
jgi:hypothetical protein